MTQYGPAVRSAFAVEARFKMEALAGAIRDGSEVSLEGMLADYDRFAAVIPGDESVLALGDLIAEHERREVPARARHELRRAREEEARGELDLERLRQSHLFLQARMPDDGEVLALGRLVERAETRQAELMQQSRIGHAPAPAPQPYGVSHEGAESLVCDWMRHLGVLDAEVTRFVGDGGIDVDSATFAAQVKNYSGSVPVQDIRALFGVATAMDKRPLLFTSGTFTVDGLAFAARAGVALLQYDAAAGSLGGLNDLGARCVEIGIPAAFQVATGQPSPG